jgi:hypothetical protein
VFFCCVLSGRGLCDELITRPEESYRLWHVVVYYHENLEDEEAIARDGLQSQKKKTDIHVQTTNVLILYGPVEITNTIHTFAPLLSLYMLAPTCFDSSLPYSRSFWIRLRYVKIQTVLAVYHIMWLTKDYCRNM